MNVLLKMASASWRGWPFSNNKDDVLEYKIERFYVKDPSCDRVDLVALVI